MTEPSELEGFHLKVVIPRAFDDNRFWPDYRSISLNRSTTSKPELFLCLRIHYVEDSKTVHNDLRRQLA